MKKSDIFEVAIKILGLYFLVTVIGALRDVLTYVAFATQTNEYKDTAPQFNTLLIVSAFIFVLLLAFAYLFTFKTKAVVKRICSPADFQETAHLFAEKKAIYEMALIIAGLLLMLWTFPDFIFRLMNYLLVIRHGGPQKTYDTSFLIIAALKIIAGLFAILKANSLSIFFAKAK